MLKQLEHVANISAELSQGHDLELPVTSADHQEAKATSQPEVHEICLVQCKVRLATNTS